MKTTHRSSFLSDGSIDDSLEDVLLRHGGLQVLKESVSLLHLILRDKVRFCYSDINTTTTQVNVVGSTYIS